jgi:hypothetical protein
MSRRHPLVQISGATQVLKQRLCPNEPGFEVHDARVMCWPAWSDQGFFEKGKDDGAIDGHHGTGW